MYVYLHLQHKYFAKSDIHWKIFESPDFSVLSLPGCSKDSMPARALFLWGRTRAKLAEARDANDQHWCRHGIWVNFLSKKFGNVIQFKMVFRFLYISIGIAIPVATGKTPIITDHSCKTRNCLILEFDYLICNIRISAFIYIEFQYFVLLVEQKN